MDFTCRKLKCKHNKNCICLLEKIDIDKNTNCKMYESDGEKPEDKTKTMFDEVPEFEPFLHNKDIGINCKANCIYNNSCECMANGIIVNNTSVNPAKCFTYLKK